MNFITLTGITWDHPRGYDPLIACSALYEKLQGVKVGWEKRSLASFGDQSLSGLADRFDLLIIDHPHAGVALETNCLMPFNDLLAQEVIDELKSQAAGPSFTSYDYRGRQWALPVDAAMQCSSYRPDLLGNAAVPQSWPEVFQLTHLLKKKNLKVGMALCATDCLCAFLTISAQFGSPVSEGKDILVDHNIGLRSLEVMRKMRDAFHESSVYWNPIQLYDHMATYHDIAYAPLAFCYSNYSREGFRKNTLMYSHAPGITNAVLGGAGIAVSAKSKHVYEAAEYAAWICSAPIQSSVYVQEHGQPANMLAWTSPAANALTSNFFVNTLSTLENAFVRPRYNGWPVFQQYLGEVLHAYLKDDTDAEKTLAHLQEAYRQSYKKSH